MKIKTVLVGWLITTLVVACAPVATAAPRADNFSFVFQYTPCGSVPVNVLDTSSGTLIHTPLDETTSITLPLRLTDNELESIYQKATSIDFFAYPSDFVIPNDQVIGNHSPKPSYQLSITNGKTTHSVTWKDDVITKSSYKKASQLRELLNLINETIQSHPEMQQLPTPKAGCA